MNPTGCPLRTIFFSRAYNPNSFELKSFHDQVLATKGIFERCSILLCQFKMLLLEDLYSATIKLEKCTVLNTTIEMIAEVAEAMGNVESMRIRIDWLDMLIGQIHKQRGCNELMHKANRLRAHVKEVVL